MAVLSPCLSSNEKKHWWISNRKVVDKYMREARSLIASQEPSEVESALSLIDSALSLSPRYEQALELKARSLLFLRRFRDVADMLQDYIPSLRTSIDDSDNSSSSSSSSSSQGLSRERVKLLDSEGSDSFESAESSVASSSLKCFSVSDLKKKVLAGLCKNCDREGHWRYLVLGQACCQLGQLEDAMALLQTGKRLATAAFRRESICWSDDSFSLLTSPSRSAAATSAESPSRAAATITDTETINHLLSHIKLLLRRRAAAIAALDAGLHSEAIRHLTKLLESRRSGGASAPRAFLAECYLLRAAAFRSSGRIAESIADCNRTLALDPSSIRALETRAGVYESLRCLTDSLHDLEHLKLLYTSALRDSGRRRRPNRREIPGKLCALSVKIQELKSRVANGESTKNENIDYYALIGLKRGCSRSELERAHRLLLLRHKPDKSTAFIDRCEVGDDRDVDSIRDRAKMSALLLYRLIQKGHSSLVATITAAEELEKQRKKMVQVQVQVQVQVPISIPIPIPPIISEPESAKSTSSNNGNVFQGVFCRDLAVVGNLLSQVGFNRPISVKFEALSC